MLAEPQGSPNGQHSTQQGEATAWVSPEPKPLEAVTDPPISPQASHPSPEVLSSCFVPEHPLPNCKLQPLERGRHPSSGDGSSRDTGTQPTPPAPSVLRGKKISCRKQPHCQSPENSQVLSKSKRLLIKQFFGGRTGIFSSC